CTRVTQEDLPDQTPPRERIPQIDHDSIRALGRSPVQDGGVETLCRLWLSVEDAELGVGLAVGAGAHARGEESACFVARDGASSFARGVAAADVHLDGRAPVADAEFDDPGRLLRPVLPALFLFGFLLLEGGDLGVDALQLRGVPHPHYVESAMSSGRWARCQWNQLGLSCVCP
ncbi:hypothetical protein, partial [Streptomyces mirabilis]|uniref:hypothetical protein n=1 Tax=Streptomyces mirabilis TaxID=68239 RepID=UPI003F4BA2DA